MAEESLADNTGTSSKQQQEELEAIKVAMDTQLKPLYELLGRLKEAPVPKFGEHPPKQFHGRRPRLFIASVCSSVIS